MNCDKNRVYGTQKKHIQLTDSTQKNSIQSINSEPRYEQKRMKIWRFGLFCQIFTVFGLFLDPGLTDSILFFGVEFVSFIRFF